MKKVKFIAKALAPVVLILVLGSVLFNALLSSRESLDTQEIQSDILERPTAKSGDGFYNILFLGIDDAAGLCDVMMLVNVNSDEQSATVAQIPRDTYAKYTDGNYRKLNGAYAALGSASGVAEFLEDAMGIEIQRYACIGLETLGKLVDAVGGVELELPCDMVYSDAEQGLFIDLRKGAVCLDGETAKQFVRFRSAYADGDLGRIDAQKLFMAALFSKLTEGISPITLGKLAAAVNGVETNMSFSDMAQIGSLLLGIEPERIGMLTLPGEEAVAEESGASYFVLCAEDNAKIMREYFCATAEFDREETFLNSRYDSFRKIYFSQNGSRPIPISEITKKGFEAIRG